MDKRLRFLWPIFNTVGIFATVLGMFGIIGMIELTGSMFLFLSGMLLIAISAAIVLYDAHKMGILKEQVCCNTEKCDPEDKRNDGDGKDE
ncbi:MAG: hypothetical protein WC153_01320 [Candidatus Methanomethylophilaceae archaeon]